MRTRLLLVSLFSLIAFATLFSQTEYPTHQAALTHLPKLYEFLAIPNDANNAEDLEPNIQWLEREFGQAGFTTQRIPTARIDVLLAQWLEAGPAAPTVLIYVQVDGQPVDPTRWANGRPWTPTLGYDRETRYEFLKDLSTAEAEVLQDSLRVFVRSASDAKGPIVMFLAAWNYLRQMGEQPSYNLKIIMDTEEELGSPNLPPVVTANRALLAADHFVILDGPPHISNEPTLVFGARGIATARLNVFGPRVPLHSGHYGNYAPNPAMRLAQLLASMKDDEGRVTIPGWYDGIRLSKRVRAELAQVPDDLKAINTELGFARPERVGNTLQEAIQYPSLNVRGLSSGWVGRAVRTIVPANAVVDIDIRLVKESDPERLIQLLRNHIERKGYYIVEGREPTDEERNTYARIAGFSARVSYGAFRTDLDAPTGIWLERALNSVLEGTVIKIRTHGGSIPIAPFVQTLNVPAVIVPLVNPDNNQHSPNENLLLANYFRGVATCYGILKTPIEQP